MFFLKFSVSIQTAEKEIQWKYRINKHVYIQNIHLLCEFCEISIHPGSSHTFSVRLSNLCSKCVSFLNV